MWSTLLLILLFLAAVILILLVLVQRGKGGGLAGALGGMGGQSAFGTKAGDTFTRITIVVATVWILLCMVSVRALHQAGSQLELGGNGGATSTTAEDSGAPAPPAEAPADGSGGENP